MPPKRNNSETNKAKAAGVTKTPRNPTNTEQAQKRKVLQEKAIEAGLTEGDPPKRVFKTVVASPPPGGTATKANRKAAQPTVESASDSDDEEAMSSKPDKGKRTAGTSAVVANAKRKATKGPAKSETEDGDNGVKVSRTVRNDLGVSMTKVETRDLSNLEEFMASKEHFPSLPKFVRSAPLMPTNVPVKELPRDYWLRNYEDVRPPWIAVSDFVPVPLVNHLMRNRKETAFGEKYEDGDNITNMEGAMHIFVTSIVLAWWHGEYFYPKGHKIAPYPARDGIAQTARLVLVSNMIHQDFEDDQVMMKLAALTKDPTRYTKDFSVPSTKDKRSKRIRADYDNKLRCWMIRHLTADGELPSIQQACSSGYTPLSPRDAANFLEDLLNGICDDVLDAVKGRFFYLNDPKKCVTGLPLLSLEVLVATAYHQFRNEINCLEKICEHQGYIYTFDPPKIFARAIKEERLMALVYSAGLKHYVQTTQLRKMHAFAVTDMPGSWLPSVELAMQDQETPVIIKQDLFTNTKTADDRYKAPQGAENAVLVSHTNSNAFGQNARYAKKGQGALEGVIGQWSSTTASSLPTREDLVSHLATQW